MNPLKILQILLVWLLGAMVSCDQVFIEDLSEESVKLNAPPANHETTNAIVSFWWDNLEDVERYKFQVATPGFAQPTRLVTDSLIQNNKIDIALEPGTYQWRVKAINPGGETPFSTRQMIVDTPKSLEGTNTVLLKPENNLFTNEKAVLFKWKSLSLASQYRFQLNETPNFDGTNLTIDTTLSNTSLAKVLNEGKYHWRVRGENDSNQTNYTKRQFTIDLTSPPQPTLQKPSDEDTVNAPVEFRWSHQNAYGDSLWLYEDSSANVPVVNNFTTNSSYQVNLDSGIYYCEVQSIDKAGNMSVKSVLSSFYVEP